MRTDDTLKLDSLPFTLAASGPIGTAAATVDLASAFMLTATAPGLTFTLPNPSDPVACDTAYIGNVGTNTFTIYGQTVAAGQFARALWSGSAWLVPPAASSTCPAPMTRTALLALRSAGTLNTSCHYIINDHVQGNLVAGTTITLHAVAGNELSQHVHVNTTYDNEAWYGRYNIDTGLVVELRDNLGNVVVDREGTTTAVASFPWGNANVQRNEVRFSTLTAALAHAGFITDNKVLDGSTLTATGATGQISANIINNTSSLNASAIAASTLVIANVVNRSSSLLAQSLTGTASVSYNEVDENSTLTATNSAGFVTQNKLSGGCNINVANSTAGSQFSRNTLRNACSIAGSVVPSVQINGNNLLNNSNISAAGFAGQCNANNLNIGSAFNIGGSSVTTNRVNNNTAQRGFTLNANNALGQVIFENNERLESTTATMSSRGTGLTTTVQQTDICNMTTFTVGPTAGNTSLLRAQFNGNSTFSHTGTGTCTISQTSVAGASALNFVATGAISIANSTIGSGASMSLNGASAVTLNRNEWVSQATLSIQSGALASLNMSNFRVEQNSQVQINVAAPNFGGGAFFVTDSTASNRSVIVKGPFANAGLTLDRTVLSANSRIDQIPSGASTRALSVAQCTLQGDGRIAHDGPASAAAVTDQLSRMTITGAARYNIRTISASLANGSDSTFSDGASITFAGDTRAVPFHVRMNGGAAATFTDVRPLLNLQRIEIGRFASLNVTDVPLAVGTCTISSTRLDNNAQLNITTQTAAFTVNNSTIDRFLVNCSGAFNNLNNNNFAGNGTITTTNSINQCQKIGSGGWNAGAFLQTICALYGNVTLTSTAANTNRITYQGVTSSIPVL
jgi:hypothetical protein